MTREDFLRGPVTVTAYDWVPEMAQGYVRDLRLRWALEEAGIPYEAELLPHAERESRENLARQPFGQVPVLGVGGRTMFESGACLWRIAEASDALLPADATERDACLSWVFAALDSLSPPIDLLAYLRLFAGDREAAGRIEPQAAGFLRLRLGHLAAFLGERAFLVGDRFTVADLLTSSCCATSRRPAISPPSRRSTPMSGATPRVRPSGGPWRRRWRRSGTMLDDTRPPPADAARPLRNLRRRR